MLTKRIRHYHRLAAPLTAFVAVCFATQAQAAGLGLGPASNFNAFVLGNMNQSSDSEGSVAIGGNANLTNYGVGDRLSNSNGTSNNLIVGGQLTYNGGQVFNGNAVYGAGPAPTVSTPNGSVEKGNPIDFAAAGQQLKALSSNLAGLTPNATSTVYSWGGVDLEGTNSDLNIFKITGNVFAPGNNVNNFTINGPTSSTIVVNVGGTNISMKNFGFSNNLQNGLRQKVLFNFYEATNIDFQNIGFEGSILAPLARLTTTYGQVDGNVIVASSEGTGEYHNYLFQGSLPNVPSSSGGGGTNLTKVPEPGILSGLVFFAAAVCMSCRKRSVALKNH